jgi:hypothetical protein
LAYGYTENPIDILSAADDRIWLGIIVYRYSQKVQYFPQSKTSPGTCFTGNTGLFFHRNALQPAPTLVLVKSCIFTGRPVEPEVPDDPCFCNVFFYNFV